MPSRIAPWLALLARPQEAQPAAPPAAAAPAPVPDAGWDPEVRRGELPNGLTWLVRRNALPQGRLSARIVKRVGSLQEQDSERGLAHFCEHMTFNGSPHFAPGTLTGDGNGISRSPHVNASTGWDDTTHVADVPVGTPAELARALDLVEDFVRGSSLDPKEIEKERGVVLAELRGRHGPGERLAEAAQRLAFGGSLHERREPGGSVDVIARAKAADIADFCRRWARPDVTGVAVTGDFDADAVATQIVARLSAIPRAAGEPPLFVPPVPPAGVVAASHVDPELTAVSVDLGWHRLGKPERHHRVRDESRQPCHGSDRAGDEGPAARPLLAIGRASFPRRLVRRTARRDERGARAAGRVPLESSEGDHATHRHDGGEAATASTSTWGQSFDWRNAGGLPAPGAVAVAECRRRPCRRAR